MSWLRRFVTALKRFVRWLRDTIAKVIGSPLQGIWQVILFVARRIKAMIDAIVEAWVRFWTGKEPHPKKPLVYRGGEASVPACATLLMVIICYVAVDVFVNLPTPRFVVMCVVVWFAAALTLWRILRRERRSAVRRFLIQVERKTGLLWMERVGTVVSLLAILSNGRRDPALIPLSVACFASFAALWFRPYEERPLLRWREPVDIPPVDIPDDGRHEKREFHWDLRIAQLEDTTDLTVWVNLDTLEQTRAENPQSKYEDGKECMDEWVTGGITLEVQQAARALNDLTVERHYSSMVEIANVLAFAQSVEYKYDKDSTGIDEYWRFPIETIYDKVGDCEDSTILAAAVLYRLGYEIALLFPPGHAALGVVVPDDLQGHFLEHEGRKYFYCETTDEGWKIGELPDRYRGQKMAVLPIERASLHVGV